MDLVKENDNDTKQAMAPFKEKMEEPR